MSLRDVVVEIGMDIADGPLTALDRKIDDVINSLRRIDPSLIVDVIDETSDLANEFNDLENVVNNTADEVERLDDTDLNKLDKEVKKADKGMGGLKKAVLGIGSALLALGIGTALKDFATGAIEAAAGAQAIEAQFDQVFQKLDKDAQGVVDNLGESFGMVPNRIKPAYTTMTSMFKGLGLETQDAMVASERAVSAVADAAAFYDKSFEDANSSLNSFIKGNYEGGESIGLFANETQIAAFASKELGKDWKKLGEADKQLARLTYAEKMMEAAGATGQALRESESYENQMGNLKQAWQDFLAKAGAPILEQAVGVLSKLSDVVSNVDPGPFMEFLSNGIDKLSIFKDITMAYYDTYKALFSGDVSGVSNIWEKIGVPPGVAEQIENLTQKYVDGFNYAKEVVSQFVTDVIVPLMPVAQEFIGNAMGFISNVVAGAMNVFDILKSVIGGLIEGVIIPLMPVARSVIETVFNVISPILRIAGSLFEGVTGAVKFLVSEIIVPLLPLASAALSGAWVIMKPILDGITWAFNGIADAVEWVINKFSLVGDVMKKFDVGEKISGVVSKITGKIPGFEVGLGRVPYDEMPALLHKDEAVLPADEADALRNAGILKGDGTDPTLDFDGASYNNAAPITNRTTSSTVQAPVQIIVQGSDKPQETARSIKEELEGWYSDLSAIFPVVMEG
ncbi:phage tail protein [Psychrobacillus vulpis]|uniref:phage tail protein n=1 Tax=Psychrobacillus vulpis TaxID=2325572 RepID=UPI0019800F89|nr:hypothetical protein [Psychrobacillus vulpis]